MSLGQIIVLTAIVAAFIVFAAVLAWGDYRTRKPARPLRDEERKEPAMADSTVTAAKSTATAQARWPQPSDDSIRHVA